MIPKIDDSRIFAAITQSGVSSPLAIETGAELVDSWTEACAVEDTRYRTIALECGWFIALDPVTFVVGAVDKLAQEHGSAMSFDPATFDPFVFEAKTTAAGSKTWTPERWYSELASGHQVATYANALKHGTFLLESGEKVWGVTAPRVLARAVSKSRPPQIWPGPAGAWIDFTPARLDATLNTYRNTAAAIRAQRRTGLVPWQLPGKHCSKVYGFKEYVCDFRRECEAGAYPTESGRFYGMSPGSTAVVEHLWKTGRITEETAPNTVVLSASSLDDYAQCPEKWRRRSVGQERGGRDSLDIGTVFHAGIAEFNEQMREAGY